MTGTSRPSSVWIIYPILGAIALGCPGCRERDDGVKVQTLEGKVEKIEVDPDGTGRITVLYYSEKRNQEVSGTAMVTGETEIMINGAVAALQDLREGEQVRGDVRIEKKGPHKVLTIVKVQVDRAKPVSGDE